MLPTGELGATRKPQQARRRNPFGLFFRVLWRNKLALFGTLFLGLLVSVIILEPLLPLPSPVRIDLTQTFAPPSSQHLLGTDENGRDVLSRLIAGGRVSLLVGLTAALLTAGIGAALGLMSGYLGGLTDRIIMRFTDGILSIPVFFLLLCIIAIWGSSPLVLILALALTRWMGVARLVRAEVLRFKEQEFIVAAKSLGARDRRVMFKHLLPQATPALIIATSIGVGEVMLIEAGISFLGLGITPPTPSWGNMLTASQYYMWSAPQLAVYPGLLILLTVLSFNSLGDAIRDALDPRSS